MSLAPCCSTANQPLHYFLSLFVVVFYLLPMYFIYSFPGYFIFYVFLAYYFFIPTSLNCFSIPPYVFLVDLSFLYKLAIPPSIQEEGTTMALSSPPMLPTQGVQFF